jgi:hypothetical protein
VRKRYAFFGYGNVSYILSYRWERRGRKGKARIVLSLL